MKTYVMPSLLSKANKCKDTLFATFNLWGRWDIARDVCSEYIDGNGPPHYQVPATIGFMHTKYGTYLFDTRDRIDGMPLFRGYTREQWGFRKD